ncbi:hypothetical protein [Acidovorax sp. SDU_ACID1]|uniref:hypothetical protein n=1 Tax=Acidovorax sp. SDU_ACID1 TaxID=3136632 RepID=UPI003873557E
MAPNHKNYHDFAEWYGLGIDEITYACQEQVTRLLAKQDADVQVLTVVTYCTGLNLFLEYVAFCSQTYEREIGLKDINRDLIDGFLLFLRARYSSTVTQKGYYYSSKAVLLALGRRGLIRIESKGDDATFPRNPFPNNDRAVVGEQPYSPRERKAVAIALKHSIQPLFAKDVVVTSKLLTSALLITALYTGRNTIPLLEMAPQALVDHPKGDRAFLFLHKRRGRRIYKAALKKDLPTGTRQDVAATAGNGIERMLRRVIDLTEPLRLDAPEGLRNRVWVFRSQRGTRLGKMIGEVIALTPNSMGRNAIALAEEYDLRDDDGNRLRINVSRLRNTFVNRVFELLDGNIALTAIAAGNTPRVAGISYLRPGHEAKKNWRFMGEILVEELKTNTIGATEKTPSGGCSDNRTGEYAPSSADAVCTSFLNCVRCRNYVVTGDDLYRVFSLYWRVLAERDQVAPRQWKQQFAHIARIIDRDVVQAGLERGVFKQKDVDAARDRARVEPHPFWKATMPLDLFKATS